MVLFKCLGAEIESRMECLAPSIHQTSKTKIIISETMVVIIAVINLPFHWCPFLELSLHAIM
jgi:hypothetical protein